ncbi:hypothetical protein, partial [Klebsiella sp. Kd70 TUC-EEAOC]|uniref:hypothetical protein n=1 Tax=Klebsiella sp. Kd70 TUC-EEAOC TaxID=2071634 RepID=UPI001CA540A1
MAAAKIGGVGCLMAFRKTQRTRSPVSAAPPGRNRAEVSGRALSPEAALARLSGLPSRRTQWTRSPVGAAPPGRNRAEVSGRAPSPEAALARLSGLPSR